MGGAGSRPHILSIMVSLCVMAVAFLAPPWRSSSHLNFKLAAGALRSTAKHMDDLAELIGVSPSWSDEELKSAADKLRAACVESKVTWAGNRNDLRARELPLALHQALPRHLLAVSPG